MKKISLLLLMLPFIAIQASGCVETKTKLLPDPIQSEERQFVSQFLSQASTIPTPIGVGTGVNTTHIGVFYYPANVSLLGERVVLHDGSIWNVRSSSRALTFNWKTNDAIVITQNYSWFSSYSFLLKNLITNVAVEVNLALPYVRNSFGFTIVQIDRNLSRVALSDGSVWELNSFKAGTWGKWTVGETVLIGINDSPMWGMLNILIDAETNSYVEARCIY